MAEIKHVGRLVETNKKCLVAYRTLPGDAYSCLVIPTESLPDSYHDAVINLVESNAGQSSYEFAEALARTQFPDGSTMLSALHSQGRLVKIGTDQVKMTPTTSVSVVLSELNQMIAEQRGIAVDGLSIKDGSAIDKVKETPKVTDPTKTSSASVNESEEIAPTGTVEEQAKQYRSQADKLAKEAAKFRRLAEELAPTKKTK